ncbi:hypothetical protein ONS95_006730 [Cadophora gregata]|uniref:uncharacterized protein n=1 Tax=Cadophora gregata TaxID=51156 RepID=UPI0026DDA760|nr:uncharacterized protein ONS95_006730 [Cadophora gregata]KAK0101567.1 hypothetical protein ONS95_006730 [Cadophora gregata]
MSSQQSSLEQLFKESQIEDLPVLSQPGQDYQRHLKPTNRRVNQNSQTPYQPNTNQTIRPSNGKPFFLLPPFFEPRIQSPNTTLLTRLENSFMAIIYIKDPYCPIIKCYEYIAQGGVESCDNRVRRLNDLGAKWGWHHGDLW